MHFGVRTTKDGKPVVWDIEANSVSTVMEQPYPLEFVRKGDTILLRLEEYDTVRTIDMKGRPRLRPERRAAGAVGVDRRTLTPSADGTRLVLKTTVTDPDTFTQPVDLQRTWVWRKGETVKPYACVERKAASR